MRYRFTSFHILAAFSLAFGIYEYREIDDWDKAELGALLPFIYFGFCLMTMLSDLVIQVLVSFLRGHDARSLIYGVEIVLLVAGGAWYYVTFYPTVHNS
jgi:hypothetical protein